MVSWNSLPLEISYQVLGWVACFSWLLCSYPQAFLNYTRKSVVGLNFDFVVFNLTKQSSYLIYNASLFFSPLIHSQYHHKYGNDEMIPVAANDVVFSIHAILMTAFIFYQVLIYDRGSQKISKTCLVITAAVWIFAAVCLIIAWPSHSWLWLVDMLNSIQVFMTSIKYIPQAYMNFRRKSTNGLSVGFILLDLTGGITNIAQMGMQSIDQRTVVNFYGNFGKTLLSLEVVLFEILFICQRYILYPSAEVKKFQVIDKERTEPLLKSSEDSESATPA